ncbi:MAG: hypothetical protein E7055_19345 [Lentisphaerae bacterium]|nr:hypothetical protein [Lentisphaerota bacterium]
MKMFLSCLAVFCLGMLSAGEKIFLNPSSPVGIFRRNSGEWHGGAARLELLYSATHLTLDAVLTVPPGRTFKAAGKPGDEMSVFGGEVFEFQIAPAGQNGVYYHFGISPSGYMYTARCRDTRWEPSRDVLESRVDGNQWHFRLSVPFSDLNAAPPKPGEVWRMNLARTDVSSGLGRITASHSGAGDFHDVSQYSDVIFGKDAPAGASIQLQDARLKQDRLLFRFTSPLRTDLPLRLEFYADGKLCGTREAVMQNGTLAAELPLPFRNLPLKSGIPAQVVLKNARTGELLCRTAGIIPMTSGMLQLDRYYYVAGHSAINFRHDLSGAVTVRLYDSSRKVIRTASGKSIPLAGLVPGRYVLEAANERNTVSRVLFVLDRTPELGPLEAGQVLTVSDGRLCRGGKPVYLFGLSQTAKSFPQFSDAFNLLYNRAAVRKNAVILAAPAGGKLIRQPFLARVFPPGQVYPEKLSAQLRQYRKQRVPRLWRISYEAQIPLAVKDADGKLVPADSKDFMYNVYRTLKKTVPETIFSIQIDSPSRIRDFAPACDVLEIAFWSSSYSRTMMPNLQRDMLKVKQDAGPDKPVIFWLGGTIPDKASRIAEEIRAAVYLSILHGFSGNIIHMGHGFLPPERSRLWSLLSGIHAEIESFYDAWAAGKEITVKIPEPFIGKAVRTASGEILLIAVNLSPNEVNFSCSLPGVPKNDRFTGYEPKLYRLSGR